MSTRLRAFHGPPDVVAADGTTSSLDLELPLVTPAALGTVADRLRTAAEDVRRIPLEERVAAIDRAAALWLAPGSRLRERALEWVPRTTGYPPAAVGWGVDRLWTALRRPDLLAALRAERDVVDGGATDTLALHVLTGNVPGAGVFGMIAALLAGTASLVKSAHREPVLPALVAQSLALADPRLGDALAVLYWPGGVRALDLVAVERADVVLAAGRAATVDAVAALGPSRLVRYGPRLSLAVVTADAADRTAAQELAWQVALFDQQGCLSPQLVLLGGDDPAVERRFVAALAEELTALGRSLPRAPLTLAESAAVWRHLERHRWRAQEGVAVEVHADLAGGWSIVVDRSGTAPASPLHRHLVVVPLTSLTDATQVLAPAYDRAEAVGYVAPERHLDDIAALAAGVGASRLCPLERMQAPPFAWRQSGHPRLGVFASRVDVPLPDTDVAPPRAAVAAVGPRRLGPA
jgi:hypothetical protein